MAWWELWWRSYSKQDTQTSPFLFVQEILPSTYLKIYQHLREERYIGDREISWQRMKKLPGAFVLISVRMSLYNLKLEMLASPPALCSGIIWVHRVCCQVYFTTFAIFTIIVLSSQLSTVRTLKTSRICFFSNYFWYRVFAQLRVITWYYLTPGNSTLIFPHFHVTTYYIILCHSLSYHICFIELYHVILFYIILYRIVSYVVYTIYCIMW